MHWCLELEKWKKKHHSGNNEWECTAKGLSMQTIKNAPTCFIARASAQHLSVFYIQECRNKISWALRGAWFACQKIVPGPHILAFEFTSYHWSHLHLKEFFRLPLISSRNIHPNWLKYFGSSGQVHFLRWTVWVENPAGSVHSKPHHKITTIASVGYWTTRSVITKSCLRIVKHSRNLWQNHTAWARTAASETL